MTAIGFASNSWHVSRFRSVFSLSLISHAVSTQQPACSTGHNFITSILSLRRASEVSYLGYLSPRPRILELSRNQQTTVLVSQACSFALGPGIISGRRRADGGRLGSGSVVWLGLWEASASGTRPSCPGSDEGPGSYHAHSHGRVWVLSRRRGVWVPQRDGERERFSPQVRESKTIREDSERRVGTGHCAPRAPAGDSTGTR